MKRPLVGVVFLYLALGAVSAQSVDQLVDQARKALFAASIDPPGNGPKLKQAVDAVRGAESLGAAKDSVTFWLIKGDVMKMISLEIATIRSVGLGSLEGFPAVENPSLEAFEAYSKALGLAAKTSDRKQAQVGVQSALGLLRQTGIQAFEGSRFDSAYLSLNAVLQAHALLKANGLPSTLDDQTAFQNQLFITGMAAMNAGKKEQAQPFFEKLVAGGSAQPVVYEALYKLKAEQDRTEAYRYLEAGRRQYPDDASLLFAEINHYLALNQLDVLIGKLKSAIDKEPDNHALHTTLGTVYDNLSQAQVQAGNPARAAEYFRSAEEHFMVAYTKDPRSFDAAYSLGSLHYNKAAVLTQGLTALEADTSAEGVRKLEVQKREALAAFDRALPFFKRAESLDPNDANTLTALSEILARKNDSAAAGEIRKRLDVVRGGGKNAASFFRE